MVTPVTHSREAPTCMNHRYVQHPASNLSCTTYPHPPQAPTRFHVQSQHTSLFCQPTCPLTPQFPQTRQDLSRPRSTPVVFTVFSSYYSKVLLNGAVLCTFSCASEWLSDRMLPRLVLLMLTCTGRELCAESHEPRHIP